MCLDLLSEISVVIDSIYIHSSIHFFLQIRICTQDHIQINEIFYPKESAQLRQIGELM